MKSTLCQAQGHRLVLAALLLAAGWPAISHGEGPGRWIALQQRERLLDLFREQGEAAAPELAEALGDDSALVRRTAAHLLVRIGKPAIAGIEKALENPDFQVRRIALRGLADMGEVRPYWEIIRADEHPSIQQEVRATLLPAVAGQDLEERLARAKQRLEERPVLHFDGESSAVLAERPTGEDFAIGSRDFTYELWFKPLTTEGDQGLMGVGRGERMHRPGINLRFRDGGLVSFFAANRRAEIRLHYRPEEVGRWMHVAVAVDRQDLAKMFVDGIPVGWTAATAAGEDDGFDAGRFIVGRRPYTNIWHFRGAISEVRIWHTARTAKEIQEHLGRQLTGKEDGLLLYWPMDEGEGDTVRDKAGGGNHGRIRGAVWK